MQGAYDELQCCFIYILYQYSIGNRFVRVFVISSFMMPRQDIEV
jgi:hypothetical protein